MLKMDIKWKSLQASPQKSSLNMSWTRDYFQVFTRHKNTQTKNTLESVCNCANKEAGQVA
jgi:hypothetical protein